MLVRANFSQAVHEDGDREPVDPAEDRETVNLEAISLRRDKTSLQTQLEGCSKMCNEDFIRNNCTSLSHEVETKFQHYLDNVGSQVSNIQGCSPWLQAEKDRLAEDSRRCSHNRSAMALEHCKKLQKTPEKYDERWRGC
ncbi:unnamed protein product [Coregonus sp. 'balchen']|nr:unnamed protein product [Coregonus sp. 'balchen']